jgi:hypothetical protein
MHPTSDDVGTPKMEHATMATRAKPPNPDQFIFRPWITTKAGRRIYASDLGLKAFKIRKRY